MQQQRRRAMLVIAHDLLVDLCPGQVGFDTGPTSCLLLENVDTTLAAGLRQNEKPDCGFRVSNALPATCAVAKDATACAARETLVREGAQARCLRR